MKPEGCGFLDKEQLEAIAQAIKEIEANQQKIMARLARIEKHLGLAPLNERGPSQGEDLSSGRGGKGPRLFPRVGKNSPFPSRGIRSSSLFSTIGKKRNPADLEMTIGGTWLNRLGVIAVILGLSFFLKYSFDNQWIGPTGRIVLGIIVGLLLLVLGEKLRSRYFAYSQGLVGAGSLALFLSVYAGYMFYHLLSPSLAFAFLVLVMANTVFTAVRHSSLPVGILGILGGYAIPFLIGNRNSSPWLFFSYLFLLTTGILGVSLYKRWGPFRLTGFAFNQLVLLIWMATTYKTSFFWPTYLFVLVNFFAFLGVATCYKLKIKEVLDDAEMLLVALNGLAFFGWSMLLLEKTFVKDYMGFYALLVAAIYILLGLIAYRIHREDKRQVYTSFALAIFLVAFAIPLQLNSLFVPYGWLMEAAFLLFIACRMGDSFLLMAGLTVLALGTMSVPGSLRGGWVCTVWSGEAVALFLMGKYLNERKLRIGAGVVLLVGVIVFALPGVARNLVSAKRFLLNLPTLELVIAFVAAALMLLLYASVNRDREEELLRKGIGIVALLIIFVFITVQNNHFFLLFPATLFSFSLGQLSLSLLWLVYALLLFLAGLKISSKELRYASLGLVGVVVGKAFLVDLATLAPLYRILLFFLLGICLLGVSYIYQKKRHIIDQGVNE